MFAEIVTALCLLYLDNLFADPSSFRSTKFARDTRPPVVFDLTNILLKLSLSRLSSIYC